MTASASAVASKRCDVTPKKSIVTSYSQSKCMINHTCMTLALPVLVLTAPRIFATDPNCSQAVAVENFWGLYLNNK